MKKIIIASMVSVVTASVLAVSSVRASVVVYYAFSNYTTGVTSQIADIGPGISTFSAGNPVGAALSFPGGSLLNAQPGFVAGNSVSMDTWTNTGKYFQFTLDATGLTAINLSYWAQASATFTSAPGVMANILLQYSTNGVGGAFTTFSSVTSSQFPGNVYSYNLSGITDLNNKTNNVFRITADPSAFPRVTGTLRVDNFTIDAVPEPSTVLLVGAGLVGLVTLLRRRS